MVQGKLLTRHPGSIHGEEETPGGRTSLRQGAGKRSSGAPDLGSEAAAEQRRNRKIGFCLWSFPGTEKKWAKGAARGGPGAPGAPLARPGVGPRRVAAWATPGSPLAPLGIFAKLSVRLVFICFFPNFWSTF